MAVQHVEAILFIQIYSLWVNDAHFYAMSHWHVLREVSCITFGAKLSNIVQIAPLLWKMVGIGQDSSL